LFDKKNGILKWTGKSSNEISQEILYKDIEYTESLVYPELNAATKSRIAPKLLDGIILLGTACSLIYFLYR